jgi:hypothetical protein
VSRALIIIVNYFRIPLKLTGIFADRINIIRDKRNFFLVCDIGVFLTSTDVDFNSH